MPVPFPPRCPRCAHRLEDWRSKSRLVNGSAFACPHCNARLGRGWIADQFGYLALALVTNFGGVLALFWYPGSITPGVFGLVYVAGALLFFGFWWLLAMLLPIRIRVLSD